jgi:chromate transporter
MVACAGGRRRPRPDDSPAPPKLPLIAASGGAAGTATAFGLWPLFWSFVKVGSVLYGSGYVLLAFLRADLVERHGWLTEEQLLDAVAVGQVTPGPVFTTATFIGYVLGGWRGAVVATAGIFLPAFVFVAISGPLVSRIRRSRLAGAFLDGVVVGSLGLMAAVTIELTRVALGRGWVADSITVAMAVVAGVLLVRYRVNSAWLVIGGAVVGWLVTWLGWIVLPA